jgi:putative hemolysin
LADNGSIFWQIILQLFLIALNAVFACAEIAIISMNDNKLAKLTAAGNSKAMRLSKLTAQPARFLATIQVGITLAGFLGSAFAADNFSDRLTGWLISLGVTIPSATLDTISVIAITIILSYFTLVLGELVPKRIAMKKAEQLALAMSGLVFFISKIFAPIVWFLTVSTNGLLRVFGIDPHAEAEEDAEEEIRMMVDVGSEKGSIDPDEKDMIHNIFEFDDTTAAEIMTHRTEVAILWEDETDEQWEKTITESRYSVYPICLDSADDVVGVLYTKDFFRLKDKKRENIMKTAVRPAYFVPESVKTDVLFRNMKKSRKHFAIVLDEYGGMSGIVTINDLLEQLVGDLDDDINEKEPLPLIERIDSSTWKIQGVAPLDLISEHLGVLLPEDEYDTFGGLVFGMLGTIPDDGTTPEVEAYGMLIKITKIHEHRIESAVVCLLEKAKDESSIVHA